MITDCREQSAFWYIVLQPVVLKNEGNMAVLDLTPHMMILVEKLWVVGPNQVLAKVVYPAEGYVPREGSNCGKLIARLDVRGPQVPWELLEIKQPETFHKSAALGNQTRCCYFNHYENLFAPGDLPAPNHRQTHYLLPGMIPSSYTNPSLGNTYVGGPLLCPQNDNQSTQFQSNPGFYGPVELNHNSDPVNSLPDFISGVPNCVRNQCTTNGCSHLCDSGHPFCSSDPTKRILSNLPPSYHRISSAHNDRKTEDFKSGYSVYQAEGFNLSIPHSRDLINSDAKVTQVVDIKTLNRGTSKLYSRNFQQCLLSIYHSIDRPAETLDTDAETEEKHHNTIISQQPPVAKEEDEDKSKIVVRLTDRKKWRYEPNRWITVSALCYELQVMCRRNKSQIRSSNFKACTIFQTNSVPDISLPSYLKRIAWFLGCPTACFVVALEYVYRLSHLCPEVELNEYSVHQIVIICIMVATKCIDDKLFKNTFYARVAGIPVTNLSALEVRLVFFLKFDLHVFPGQYVARYESMLRDNQGPDMVIIQPDGIAAEGDEK